MEQLSSPPAWLDLLNAMQKEWRELEIESGRNPDGQIEASLRDCGKWPSQYRPLQRH